MTVRELQGKLADLCFDGHADKKIVIMIDSELCEIGNVRVGEDVRVLAKRNPVAKVLPGGVKPQ